MERSKIKHIVINPLLFIVGASLIMFSVGRELLGYIGLGLIFSGGLCSYILINHLYSHALKKANSCQ